MSCANSTQQAKRTRNDEGIRADSDSGRAAAGCSRFTYGLCMTAREELRRLVDELPEDRVSVALVGVQRLASTFDSSGWPPPWFGAVRSERTDTSERVDEPPADGFGR